MTRKSDRCSGELMRSAPWFRRQAETNFFDFVIRVPKFSSQKNPRCRGHDRQRARHVRYAIYCDLGRGRGVGRGLGVGAILGVAVTVGVAVAVAVAVGVGLGVGVGVAVGATGTIA